MTALNRLYIDRADRQSSGSQERLSVGWAAAGILAISVLLWGAIIAPIMLL